MAKKVRDVMTENPACVSPSQSLAEAARILRDEDVGSLPVCEDDRVIGIVTDRDIVIRVIAEGREPEQTTVGEISSKELVTVSPDDDFEDAMRLLAEHQVRRLPVVEEDRLVGILAQADIARVGKDAKTGEVVEEISR